MKEKKITITLEDYSAAVDAVVKKIGTCAGSNVEAKNVMMQIAFKVAWDLWNWLEQATKLETVVDAIAKVADQMIEEREEEKRR